MIKDKIRLCQLCGGIIPYYRNGNSKYCSDDCYNDNKAIEAVETNKTKAFERALLRNDECIHQLFEIYQSNYYITAKFLIDKNFNWSVYNATAYINNIKAKKIIRYGYTLFINQTVQLWKL